MTKQQQQNLSSLTVDDFWELPIMAADAETNENIDYVYQQKPNIERARQLTKNFGISQEVAKLSTQAAACWADYDYDDSKLNEEYSEGYEEIFITQATRYLQVKGVLKGNKNRFLDYLVSDYTCDNDSVKMSPRTFLWRKVRNCTIFFMIIGLLEWRIYHMVTTPDISRPGVFLIVTFVGIVGLLNFRNIPAQYQARKKLHAYLLKERLQHE